MLLNRTKKEYSTDSQIQTHAKAHPISQRKQQAQDLQAAVPASQGDASEEDEKELAPRTRNSRRRTKAEDDDYDVACKQDDKKSKKKRKKAADQSSKKSTH